jgi:crossover junction endodeoxyribonuclease RuvC
MNVLGVDPGFASIGWCVARVMGGDIVPTLCGTFTTEKETRKVVVRASEDNIRRAQLVYGFFKEKIVEENISLIATETMSWPRNSAIVAKLGIFWGTLSALGTQLGTPIIQASPVDIKKSVTGNGKASKEEMVKAIESRFPFMTLPHQETLKEHAADACGAIIACSPSEMFKWAMKHSA